MKRAKREKKEYKLDGVLGYFCATVYAFCLVCIRFLDYIEKWCTYRFMFISIGMFAVIVIMFLNCTMCLGTCPNKKLLSEINDFDMMTNNKKEIIGQRDTLLKYFNGIKYTKVMKRIIIGAEVVACIFVFVLFMKNVDFTNRITGVIIDIETAVMAFWFYVDNHYKFKIVKNLKC